MADNLFPDVEGAGGIIPPQITTAAPAPAAPTPAAPVAPTVQQSSPVPAGVGMPAPQQAPDWTPSRGNDGLDSSNTITKSSGLPRQRTWSEQYPSIMSGLSPSEKDYTSGPAPQSLFPDYGKNFAASRAAEETSAASANGWARNNALYDAITKRNEQVKDATGQELEHPMDGGYLAEAQKNVSSEWENEGKSPFGANLQQFGEDVSQEQARIWHQHLLDLADQQPNTDAGRDAIQAIGADRPIAKDAIDLGLDASKNAAEIYQHSGDSVGAWLGSTVGGMVGYFRNPINVLGAVAPGGGATITEARIAAPVLKIAAGMVESGVRQGLIMAGLQGVQERDVQSYREEAGLPHGVVPGLYDVGEAFLNGAVPGAVIHGIHMIGAHFMGPSSSAMIDEFLRKARGMPPNPDLTAGAAAFNDTVRSWERANRPSLPKPGGPAMGEPPAEGPSPNEPIEPSPPPQGMPPGTITGQLTEEPFEDVSKTLQPGESATQITINGKTQTVRSSVDATPAKTPWVEYPNRYDRPNAKGVPIGEFDSNNPSNMPNGMMSAAARDKAQAEWNEYQARKAQYGSPKPGEALPGGERPVFKVPPTVALPPPETAATTARIDNAEDSARNAPPAVNGQSPKAVLRAYGDEVRRGENADSPPAILPPTRPFSPPLQLPVDATPEMATEFAARQNLSQANFRSPLEAAKVLRENPERWNTTVADHPMMEDAHGLMRLSPTAWSMVNDRSITPREGAIIGNIISDVSKHAGVAARVIEAKGLPEHQQIKLIHDLGAEDRKRLIQHEAFGGRELTKALAPQRVAVYSAIAKMLKDPENLHLLEKMEATATGVELAQGTTPAAPLDMMGRVSRIGDMMTQLGNGNREISAALNRAAATVAEGHSPGLAAKSFLRAVDKAFQGKVPNVESQLIEPTGISFDLDTPQGIEAYTHAVQMENKMRAPFRGETATQHIFTDMTNKLTDAGMPREEAEINAALMTARYETRAVRLGYHPDVARRLYDNDNWRIQRDQGARSTENAGGPPKHQGRHFEVMQKIGLGKREQSLGIFRTKDGAEKAMKGLKGARIVARKEGPQHLHAFIGNWIKEHGKLRFEGDLEERIPKNWMYPRPLETNDLKKQKLKLPGQSLDRLREAVAEQGYLGHPGAAAQGTDLNDLTEAMMNGKEIYPIGIREIIAEHAEEKEAAIRDANRKEEEAAENQYYAPEEARIHAWAAAYGSAVNDNSILRKAAILMKDDPELSPDNAVERAALMTTDHQDVDPGEDPFEGIDSQALFQSGREVPTYYWAAERAVEGMTQAKASPAQWLSTIKNTPGIKPDELEYLGLEKWLNGLGEKSVTKAQVADYIRANDLQLKEVHRGIDTSSELEDALEKEAVAKQNYYEAVKAQGGNSGLFGPHVTALREAQNAVIRARMNLQLPKFQQYQIPGAVPGSYRELQVILPVPPGGTAFKTSHWPEPNTLAHARTNERIIDGKRALTVEEIQSDWHQQGRKEGYVKPGMEGQWGPGNRGVIPDAPFKTSWPELMMKRLIRMAADGGHDTLAWTSGSVQNERWDMARYVKQISWFEDRGNLQSVGHDSTVRLHEGAKTREDVEKMIGKELTDKLMEQPSRDAGHGLGTARTIEGNRMRVEGKGHLEFYDKILVNAASKITKKFGAKIGTARVGEAKGLTLEQFSRMSIEENPDGKGFDILGDDAAIYGPHATREDAEKWIYQHAIEPDATALEGFSETGRAGLRLAREEAAALRARLRPEEIAKLEEINERLGRETFDRMLARNKKNGANLHTLEITPELREAAQTVGFPLFQGGGFAPRARIDFRENERTVTLFRTADKGSFMHEMSHGFLNDLIADAARPDAPQRLKDDLAEVLKHLGVETPEDIKAEHHEKWASSFERYISEGRAPSDRLKRVFEMFKQWMLHIYGRLEEIGVPINDAIRAVFDRMLARDEEIHAARHAERPAVPIPEPSAAPSAMGYVANPDKGSVVEVPRTKTFAGTTPAQAVVAEGPSGPSLAMAEAGQGPQAPSEGKHPGLTVQEVLARPEVQEAITRPRFINRQYHVNYLAGSNAKGDGTYIDTSVPQQMPFKGINGGEVTADPAKYLNIHEQVEHALNVELGFKYYPAHAVATVHEEAAVEADGIDFKDYQAKMTQLSDASEKRGFTNPPPDLYLKPYPHKEEHFLANEEHHGRRLAAGVPTDMTERTARTAIDNTAAQARMTGTPEHERLGHTLTSVKPLLDQIFPKQALEHTPGQAYEIARGKYHASVADLEPARQALHESNAEREQLEANVGQATNPEEEAAATEALQARRMQPQTKGRSVIEKWSKTIEARHEADDRLAELEKTEAGNQGLVPGVRPVTDADRLRVAARKPLRGGNAPAGGLFDETKTGQTDIMDLYPTGPNGEFETREKATGPSRSGELADLMDRNVPKEGQTFFQPARNSDFETYMENLNISGQIPQDEYDAIMAQYRADSATIGPVEAEAIAVVSMRAKKAQDDLNRALEVRIIDRLKRAIGEFRNARGTTDPFKAIHALFENSGYAKFISARAYGEAYIGIFNSKVADALIHFRRGGLREALMLKGRGVTGGRANLAGVPDLIKAMYGEEAPAQYKALAKQIQEAHNWLVDQTNALGGNKIAKIKNYTPQSHNESAVANAGHKALPGVQKANRRQGGPLKQWSMFIDPLLNWGEMFDPATGNKFDTKILTDARKAMILKYVWRKIVTNGGITQKAAMHPIQRGGLNTADHRFLVFKDADSYMKYHQEFGKGSLFDSLMGHGHHLAREIGMKKVFGPRPQFTMNWLKGVVDEEMSKVQAGDPSLFMKKRDAEFFKHEIDAYYENFRGVRPTENLLTMSGEALMNLERSVLLGSAAIPHANSNWFIQGFRRQLNGTPWVFRTIPMVLRSMNRGTKDQMLRAALDIESGAHDLGRGARQLAGMQRVVNFTRILPDRTTNWGGLIPIVDANKAAFFRDMMSYFGDNLRTDFNKLEPRFLERLKGYGIDETGWKLMQLSPASAPGSNRAPTAKWLTWKDIADVGQTKPQEVYRALGLQWPQLTTDSKENLEILQRARDNSAGIMMDVATDYLAMLHSEREAAVPQSSWRVNATSKAVFGKSFLGQSPMMFKSFIGSMMLTQAEALSHEFQRGGARGAIGGAGLAAELLIVLTVLGMLSLQMKTIRSGKDPLPMNPLTKKGQVTWARAALTGGSFGIFGDLLAADRTAYGAGPMETMAGPTIGIPLELAEGAKNFVESYWSKHPKAVGAAAGEMGSTVLQNMVPFLPTNFLTAAPYQRLVVDRLRWMSNPAGHGRTLRADQKLFEQQGNHYWWRPGHLTPDRAPRLW